MMLNPRIGSQVQLWYKNKEMPLQGRTGTVLVASRRRPRNHGVEIDGRLVVVPCGNLRRPE